MKKGQAAAYGGTFLILVLGALVLTKISATGEVERTVVTTEGKLISFVNDAEFILKNFNESIKTISSRSAYDLGKTGGLDVELYWTKDYPTMDTLKKVLLERIKDNFPESYEEDTKRVDWGVSNIHVTRYDVAPCGPLDDSSCFFVNGTRYFSIYDESIDAEIALDIPIDSQIFSSYFKLLYIGREILENDNYVERFNDYINLSNKLEADFSGIDFRITVTERDTLPDILNIIIEDNQCNIDFHCLAPRYPDEGTIVYGGDAIIYDYIRLHIKVEADQTEISVPFLDFTITLEDESGNTELTCS